MAGAIKHMERSRKTRNKNYSEFRRFSMRANSIGNSQKKQKSMKEKIAGLIASMFGRKHQDR